MVEIVWTEPALSDLDAIADFIALENSVAAQKLVHTIFRHVEQLTDHPKSGSKPAELKGRNYRQIIQPSCRVFYRQGDNCVFILQVMRSKFESTTRNPNRMSGPEILGLPDILKNRRVRFTPYTQLNDPFECRFTVNPRPGEEAKAIQDDYNAEWACQLISFARTWQPVIKFA